MGVDPALQRLGQIKHIVVLMMENRSFDQMLGYLKHANPPLTDVDGLEGTETNPDDQGQPQQVFPWGPDETVLYPPQDTSGKILDPCHSPECVEQQVSNNSTGFVENFIATRRDAEGNPVEIPAQYRKLPMGYYTGEHLPVYDFLARNYCVCDAWHSSIPGDTWPNRLFALAGRQADPEAESFLGKIEQDIKHLIPFLKNAPIFDVPAFTRELQDGQWRWYSHDPATLRAADSNYRDPTDLKTDNFAFFNRLQVSALTQALEAAFVTPESFLDDVANGTLRDVSWIDPNFVDLKVLDPSSNDDHPPSDVRAGQGLVLEVYEALRSGKDWDDTLFVVAYDEHGGFYDHVELPPLPLDDHSGYTTYGVRVPAIVIGPRVLNQVSHQLFDHTSLINTILTRFATDPAASIGRMGPRVKEAPHLGVLLGDQPRQGIPDPTTPRERIDEWHLEARQERRPGPGSIPSPAPDGAGHAFELHDFQKEFVSFALAMHAAGLPAGQP